MFVSLFSRVVVRELDAASLAQIRQACLEETQKLDEVEHPKNQTDEDQKPNPPGPDSPKTTNEKFQSSTDPEATLTRQQGLRARPRYKNHRVVDDAQGIVTALKTTTGIVNEARELMGLIDQHQANAGVAAKTIIADCKYGTVENYIACQNRKLRTHMADLLASSVGSGRRDEIYPESQFLYRAQSDTYLCPAGQVMRPRRLHPVRLSWEYVTKRGVCLNCRLQEFCTRSKTGRSLTRHRDQALLDRARRQATTKRAKLDRKRRQHLVERGFPDAANRHGFKRARWRGLVKQSIQDLLIATIQNIRKLVATTQNLPGKVWEALTRILSWPAVTLHTLFTSSPPRHLVLALS